MSSLRITLCTSALAVAALTPAAYAADGGGGVSVAPAKPVPGSEVMLTAECAERTAVAVSAAFVTDVRLTVADTADGVLIGETRVRSSLEAGAYAVKVRCGETEHKGTIAVAPASARQPSGQQPAAPVSPAAPASPVAPVAAGGGGAARLAAAEAREEGPGAAQVGTGLALAGAAAVAVVRGRLRRSRRTG